LLLSHGTNVMVGAKQMVEDMISNHVKDTI